MVNPVCRGIGRGKLLARIRLFLHGRNVVPSVWALQFFAISPSPFYFSSFIMEVLEGNTLEGKDEKYIYGRHWYSTWRPGTQGPSYKSETRFRFSFGRETSGAAMQGEVEQVDRRDGIKFLPLFPGIASPALPSQIGLGCGLEIVFVNAFKK